MLPETNLTIYKSFRNIPGITVRVAPAFSVRDVLDAEQIILTAGALETLDAVYGKTAAAAPTEEAS